VRRRRRRWAGDPHLRETGFNRLWFGETVSQAGSEITFLAIPLTALLLLDASALEMGILGAAGSAASLVFGLPAGVWVDRFERRRMMQLANVARMIVISLVALLAWRDALSMPVLYGATFLIGTFTLIFDSAFAAYLPRLLRKRGLLEANARMQASVATAEVAGPGVSGAMVQLLGAPLTLLVDAVTFLASIFALRTLPPAAATPQDGADAHEASYAAIRGGIAFIARDAVMRPLTVAAAHFNVFTSMFFAVYMLYVVRELDFSPLTLGLLTVAGGLAGITMAGSAGRLARRVGMGRLLIVVYALPGMGALLVPLAGTTGRIPALLLVGTCQVVWAGSVVVNLTLSETLKQSIVPDGLLGRVSATIRFVSWGGEPIGALIGGVLASAVLGLSGTLVLAGVGVLLSAIWPLCSASVRRTSEAPRPSPEHEADVALETASTVTQGDEPAHAKHL